MSWSVRRQQNTYFEKVDNHTTSNYKNRSLEIGSSDVPSPSSQELARSKRLLSDLSILKNTRIKGARIPECILVGADICPCEIVVQKVERRL